MTNLEGVEFRESWSGCKETSPRVLEFRLANYYWENNMLTYPRNLLSFKPMFKVFGGHRMSNHPKDREPWHSEDALSQRWQHTYYRGSFFQILVEKC